MIKKHLFAPGPTPIPSETLLSMARPIDHHRTAESAELIDRVSEKLRHVFQTKNDVLILASSGTGAMEASIANLFSRNDRVIAIRSGKFGERWGLICEAYGLELDPIDVELGRSIEPQIVADRLKKYPETKAVLSTLCETSTGALHDIKSLTEITRDRETLLIVDAVSALGADDLPMDSWGVDAIVSCSHKGLMTPPGLSFVSFSEKAWSVAKNSKLPKFYFDLEKVRASSRKRSTPFTPAIMLISALDHSLELICAEGIRNVLDRHARLATATRNAVKAIGLDLFAENPANTVTSIRLPKKIDGKAFLKMMRQKHGITYAGGQALLSGEIIRIAHLGWVCEHDVIVAISAFERGLSEVGHDLNFGSGVVAAQKIFRETEII